MDKHFYTRLQHDEVLSWFRGIDGFKDYHNILPEHDNWDDAIAIE